MFLFLREGGYWLAWAGFDDPELTCMFSDWKQSALRFLTRPRLGQGAMGLSEDSLVMKKHNERYLYFYYLLIVYTMLEKVGARGGGPAFFFLSKLHLIDEMISYGMRCYIYWSIA